MLRIGDKVLSVNELERDIYVFRYPWGGLPIDQISATWQRISEMLPEGSIKIAIPNSCSIEKMSVGQLMQLINQINDTIKRKIEEDDGDYDEEV